jgi:iron complex transport system permease protein
VVIAFAGVIGFIGLAAPHIARRLMGEGNRWYLAGTVLTGSILLTASDLTARLVMAPRVLPAAIVTAFLGAPVFIYLLIRGYSR